VFLPLHDKNALRFIPFQRVTIGLIAINIAVFYWQFMLSEQQVTAVVWSGGLTPAALMGIGNIPAQYVWLPPEITLFTHMFLHGSWLHLIANMVFLWVFGDNVEDAMGHFKFLVFYLLCGMAAGYAHAFMDPASEVPLVGASGATAGIIGAYLLLYPRVKVWILLLLRIPVRLPAYWVLVAWLSFQIFFVVTEVEDSTAWWAHLGGFALGVALTPFFKRRDMPLFGRAAS
jgi:membrane associated rhomboid family serine protease